MYNVLSNIKTVVTKISVINWYSRLLFPLDGLYTDLNVLFVYSNISTAT